MRQRQTPLPIEINPRRAFDRMFGQTGRTKEDSSILDAFKDQVADLQKKVGPRDRTAVGDYLDSVREIERRIEKVGTDQRAIRGCRRRPAEFLIPTKSTSRQCTTC